MTGYVRRAGAFAAVGTIALAAPIAGPLTAVAFLAVALLAAFVVEEGRLFVLFERPGDREAGRLYGLAGFSFAAAGLALLATTSVFEMPVTAFVAAVLVVAYGNLGEVAVLSRFESELLGTVGFGVGGVLAAGAGMVAAATLGGLPVPSLAEVVFLVAAGTLLAALLRSVLFPQDDPLVMVSVGLLLWFLSDLPMPLTLETVLGALVVTTALGYVAYALDTASIPGMLTGTFLGLLTIVLGGPGWFVVLIAFFGIGGLATKFRYEEKERRGVAEDNEGARGSGNVLGNSAIALLALLGYAGAQGLAVSPALFKFAFAGAVATAMSDTLSSEIGGVYDRPRLITTMEVVSPGTDGGVTWQGVVAGVAGSGVVALLSLVLLGSVGALGAIGVAVAGFAGMNVDSLLGATIEGNWLSNQGVNFFATLSGAVTAALAALALGLG